MNVTGFQGIGIEKAIKSVISMNPQECLRIDKRDFETDDKAIKHWNSHSLRGKKVSQLGKSQTKKVELSRVSSGDGPWVE